MTYTLTTITGLTYIISAHQKANIESYIASGQKVFYIGEALVVTGQVTGILPTEMYHSKMKAPLAQKGLKACKRCGTILPVNDKCPCKEQPDKFPDLLTVARQENPELARQLDALAERKALPPSA